MTFYTPHPTVIAVANQKGGVGKTTTAVTVAHGLAIAGHKTLIIDTDPQGHVALALGMPKASGLYRLIVDGEAITKCRDHARESLDIIASDKTTEKANRWLTTADYRETAIRNAVARANYEYIILDMAPSLNTIHVAALVASDILIIPVKLDHLALDGVNEVIRSMAELNRNGANIQKFMIVPTFFDRTTNESKLQLEKLYQFFGSAAVAAPIPSDTRVREAPAFGKTIWEHSPDSPAIVGYKLSVHGGYKPIGGYAAAMNSLQNIIEG